jgi:tetratricopeptide (TPR) repeat protein
MIFTLGVKSRSAVRPVMALTLIIAITVLGASCGASKSSGSPKTTADAKSNAAAVQSLLQEGISQAQAKMLDQAATTFKNVLLLSPKNVYALYNLGVIDQSEKNATGALSYYDQALRADGTYTPAMYNKAIILEATNLDAALALYKQIVLINPKASTAYLRMAFVYAKQGQTLKATEARTKAVALDASLSKYPLPAKCNQPNC